MDRIRAWSHAYDRMPTGRRMRVFFGFLVPFLLLGVVLRLVGFYPIPVLLVQCVILVVICGLRLASVRAIR